MKRMRRSNRATAGYLSEDPEEYLLAYAGVYLQEEIRAEGAVRRIENFSRFLRSAAAMK